MIGIQGCISNKNIKCPIPDLPAKGYVKWDKDTNTVEADKGGREFLINYIATRNICGK